MIELPASNNIATNHRGLVISEILSKTESCLSHLIEWRLVCREAA
jgi:hypothetical protein